MLRDRPIRSEMGDDHHTDEMINKDKG
jgi:hypothetical protein